MSALLNSNKGKKPQNEVCSFTLLYGFLFIIYYKKLSKATKLSVYLGKSLSEFD